MKKYISLIFYNILFVLNSNESLNIGQTDKTENFKIDPSIAIFLAIFLIVFFIGLFVGLKAGRIRGYFVAEKELTKKIPEIRRDAIARSRSALTGQFSEQLAPFFPDFPFNPNEARFIGKPVDFIVFCGLDEGEVEEIIFVEVKSGKSFLNSNEKSLKKAVENGRVKWFEYRIPDKV